MNITISSPGSPGTSYTDDVKKMIITFFDELNSNPDFDSLSQFKAHLEELGYSNDYVRNILPFLQFCGIVQYGNMKIFQNKEFFTNIGCAYVEILKCIEVVSGEKENDAQKQILSSLEDMQEIIFFQCLVNMMKSPSCKYAVDYFDVLRFVCKYDYIDITEYSLLIYERNQGGENYIDSMGKIVQQYRKGEIEIHVTSSTRKKNGKVNTFSYLNSILVRAGVIIKKNKKFYIVEKRRTEIETAISEVIKCQKLVK